MKKYMKKLIIMGIPHHGNLGDNAIAIAEENIIDTYFSEYEKYIMPEERLPECIKKAKNYISDEDIIFLHGGGNIGDTYMYVEKARREVIQTFPNNKIIIFPQTSYFSDTKNGKEQLEIAKVIYNSHKNLVILAREEKSFRFMSENFFNAKVYLTPDIVMTLERKANKNRKGVLFLLRNDIEKILDNESLDNIKQMIKKQYDSYKASDMHIGNVNLDGSYRNKILQEKFHELQTSELVITDRLHGMIFSAITETPCIAFGNYNHKNIESYKWFQNLNYIQFCKDEKKVEELIHSLRNVKNINYDSFFAIDRIVSILKKEIC